MPQGSMSVHDCQCQQSRWAGGVDAGGVADEVGASVAPSLGGLEKVDKSMNRLTMLFLFSCDTGPIG